MYDRLSWLPVNFLVHVNRAVSCRIVFYWNSWNATDNRTDQRFSVVKSLDSLHSRHAVDTSDNQRQVDSKVWQLAGGRMHSMVTHWLAIWRRAVIRNYEQTDTDDHRSVITHVCTNVIAFDVTWVWCGWKSLAAYQVLSSAWANNRTVNLCHFPSAVLLDIGIILS